MAEVLQEKELVKHVEEKLKLASNRPQELQWFINIAYFAGKQWLLVDKVNKKLIEAPKSDGEVRYTANKIQPIVRTERAKILRNKPIMIAIPASTDDNDIKAARTEEKVIEWLEQELDLPEKDRRLVEWGLVAIGFIEPFWNPNKGMAIPDPETGEVFKMGDVDIDVVSPFELKIDPSAKSWDEVRWVCKEKARDIEYIKSVYGKDVPPEDNLSAGNMFESQIMDITLLTGEQGSSTKKCENMAIVKEYWEMPTSKHPKGQRITISNGVLLFHEEDIGFGEEDNTERELPFKPFFHIVVPGRLYPTNVTEQCIPVQREYNKSRSQIIKNNELMANPIWLVPKGSLEPGVGITTKSGQVIEYNHGIGKPEMAQPAQLSAEIYKNLELCDSELEFISGQHETSHGSAPPGVKSGVAISYLQEQDDTKLGPTIDNFHDCKRAYIKYLVKILRFRYTEDRTVNLLGQNNKLETLTFRGSDLTAADVRIQAGSAMQLSKSAKQQYIMELIGSEVLNPVQDRNLILKMLELGLPESLYDDYAIDVNKAQEEQEKWMKGDFNTLTRDFFNHEVHAMEHDKFRKSPDYEELPDEFKMQIDLHVEEHKKYIMQNLLSQMQAEMQAQPPQPAA